MTTKILAGFEVRQPKTKNSPAISGGTPVYFTLHHLAAFGMTQKAGKTTLLEALIVRSALRALAFILKRGESGFHSYNRVMPFFKGRSDWHWLEGLLNVSLQERVKFEPGMRDAIMRAADGTKGDLGLIAAKVAKLQKDERNAFKRDVYHKLSVYLRDVSTHMGKYTFTDKLVLEQGVNVMDLSPMEEYPEIQQMVIGASLEEIHTVMRDVIAVVPEAWEQLPQTKMTPVKWAAERFIRKGAAIGNFLWIDSQDTGGLDKTPLRQVDNWFFGRMKEAHEVERIGKQLLGVKLPPGEIETLPLGHFITVVGNKVQKIYALPSGVPPDVGAAVATGRMTPEQVQERFLKPLPPTQYKPRKPVMSEVDRIRELLKGNEEREKQRAIEAKADADKLRELLNKPTQTQSTLEVPPAPPVVEEQPAQTVPNHVPAQTTQNAASRPAEVYTVPENNAQTMEVIEPVQLIAVKDDRGVLTADTTTLLGQVAGLILEGVVKPGNRLKMSDFRRMTQEEYGGVWNENQMLDTLRSMVAPPYRLFRHEIASNRQNWFILRETALKQVKQA